MKLGPWVSRDTWASLRGACDRFITHLDYTVVVVVVVAAVVAAGATGAVGASVIGGEEDTTSDVRADALFCAIHVWCYLNLSSL